MAGRGLSLAVVVTAGGYGQRLGGDGPKQYRPILGVPMVQRTLAALDECPDVDAMVVVVNEEDVDFCSDVIVAERFDTVRSVVGGGAERAFSVRAGLAELARLGTWDLAGVHDGARPLVTCDEVSWAVGKLTADPRLDGVVLAVPSTDTLKQVDDDGEVVRTLPREQVWRAQTPQVFRWATLVEAYRAPDEVLAAATDDASLVEAHGGRIGLVPGSPENIKVTTLVDLAVAEKILAERRR